MRSSRRSIALLADTHGHLDPRIAEVACGCDLIVHAGDIGGDFILRALRAGGAELVAIAGNNDTLRHWPAGERDELDNLPASVTIDLPGGTLVVVHGDRLRAHDRHDRLRAQYPDAAAVVYGHSHRAVSDTDATPWILNPGAAGRTRTYGGPACLLLEARSRRWKLQPYRFPLER
jgi:putative phosphoesterase